ncbi:MAG TPA: ABC transporter permease [Anaerolineae bacterium]|nr:ABC transporter permease [Anaerolineae bacterium]
MIRIIDIAQNDLRQLLRDRKTFMFLLAMPILFTVMFGYAFGAFNSGGAADSRIPVGYLDQDNSRISHQLHDLLAASKVIRLAEDQAHSTAELEQLVSDKKIAAALVVPIDYGRANLAGKHPRLTLIADTSTSTGTTIQADVLATANRLDSSVSIALSAEQIAGDSVPFRPTFEKSLSAWQNPPIEIESTLSPALKNLQDDGTYNLGLANTAPGMMLQFAIAGLLTAAQIIVVERKSYSLQRLLTTATRRIHILLGHYLAIFILIFTQFLLLIVFESIVFKVGYLRMPAATFVMAISAAACIAGLGLLIGILARTEEQAVIFSLIPMFVLAGLGGAWVSLEVTGAAFQAIGHLSPIAWALDGFKNVIVRGLGVESVLLPAAALMVYAIVFFGLATWRFWTAEER